MSSEYGGECTVDEDCEIFDYEEGLPISTEVTCNQNINSCLLNYQTEWGFIYETAQICISTDYMDNDGNIYIDTDSELYNNSKGSNYNPNWSHNMENNKMIITDGRRFDTMHGEPNPWYISGATINQNDLTGDYYYSAPYSIAIDACSNPGTYLATEQSFNLLNGAENAWIALKWKNFYREELLYG